MSIFIAPHNDDETLFGAFTILREQPLVVIVCDGHVQQERGLPVTWAQRRMETIEALDIIGNGLCVKFLGLSDAANITASVVREALRCELGTRWMYGEPVYAPAFEINGHAQHNAVAQSIPDGRSVTRYLTYTTVGKSTGARPVPILDPSWVGLKLRALACYESQFSLDPRMGCWPHFLRSQEEYYV